MVLVYLVMQGIKYKAQCANMGAIVTQLSYVSLGPLEPSPLKKGVILKTTYDESIKTSSPAILIRQDAFQLIFDQQICEHIEFYGKVVIGILNGVRTSGPYTTTNAHFSLMTLTRR